MTASHLWYNFKFVQHQGRYLFPALIPMGLFSALGLREWARLLARLTALLLPLENRKVGLEYAAERAVLALFYLGFLALDLVCLDRFIVPYFAL